MAPETAPADIITTNGRRYRAIKEGKATILTPQDNQAGEDGGEVQQVFYNPIQQYNRDLSVLAIKTYGEHALERRRQHIQERANKHQGRKRKRGQEEAEKEEGCDCEHETESRQPAAAQDLKTSEPQDALAADSGKELPLKLPFKILDALSASGLRALRYGHEIPFVTSVTANDLSAAAAQSIQLNVDHNGLGHVISVTNDDALAHMYRAIADDLSHRDRHGNSGKARKFDVIDLDPYGTAAPFLDAAVQAVRDDGGLLCITCTDSAVWAGHSYCEKAFSLYGGVPVKGLHSHEAGLRLILNAVASSGARYGLAIEPLLSLSIDYYTKLFVKVTRSPNAVKFLGAKTVLLYSCDSGCGAWETQPVLRTRQATHKSGKGFYYKHGMALGPTADRLCVHCGFKMHISGPMYGGRIHSSEFIQQLLDQLPKLDRGVYGTLPRLEGMLQTALEENLQGPGEQDQAESKEARLAAVDPCPFFIIPGKVAGVLSCAAPGDDMFRGALKHLGYQVTRSHCRPGSIKTDASWQTLWWVIAEYIRQKAPVKTSKFKPTMAAYKILKDHGILGQGDEEHASTCRSVDSTVDGALNAACESGSDKNEAPQGAKSKGAGVEAPLGEAELRKTLVFDEELARLGRQRGGQRVVRYQMNPHAHWGPMSRARGT